MEILASTTLKLLKTTALKYKWQTSPIDNNSFNLNLSSKKTSLQHLTKAREQTIISTRIDKDIITAITTVMVTLTLDTDITVIIDTTNLDLQVWQALLNI